MLDEEGTLQREHVAPALMLSAAKQRHALLCSTEGDKNRLKVVVNKHK
jgi:hypothetical protein